MESDESVAESAPIIFHHSLVHTCCKNRCLASFSLLKLIDVVKLSGKYVCKRSFRDIFGKSEKRLRKVIPLHRSGAVTAMKVQRVYNKSEKCVIARSWMKRYFEHIGDKMPHLQQIHLPHFLSKKALCVRN